MIVTIRKVDHPRNKHKFKTHRIDQDWNDGGSEIRFLNVEDYKNLSTSNRHGNKVHDLKHEHHPDVKINLKYWVIQIEDNDY